MYTYDNIAFFVAGLAGLGTPSLAEAINAGWVTNQTG